MRGTTALAALLFVAAPVDAQEYVRNADRPDGVAPVGITTERAQPRNTIQLSYRFSRMHAQG